jgi:dipeptidyl aminopeptidase/acylaminoacyl peptidase
LECESTALFTTPINAKVPCMRVFKSLRECKSQAIVPKFFEFVILLATFSSLGWIGWCQEPVPPRIEDLYLADSVLSPIEIEDGKGAIYCRSRVDPWTRTVKQSLWKATETGVPRALEAGEPDAHSPMLTPDGKWILFLSSRPFADGTSAFSPVPPYSDPAADIWFLPVEGGKAIPLGGQGKPYGRVLTDRFYSRISFSPDGKKLTFVADLGLDPRTEDELRNDVIVVRDDQGEGYEGYGPTQIWVADIAEKPDTVAASKIERVTSDDFWYGDPQWAPDGSFLVVHANRSQDQESVRFSINRNYDLWKIDLATKELRQLTQSVGPEFSPRIAPDGKRLVCLSSPRNGPHADVYNLMVIDLLDATHPARLVFNHHEAQGEPPSLPPVNPLPDVCWKDSHRVVYNAFRGLKSETQLIDIDLGPEAIHEAHQETLGRPPSKPKATLNFSRAPVGPRLKAEDEIVQWKSFDGMEIDGVLTLPPDSIAKPPYKLLLLPHGGPHSRASSGGGFDVQLFACNGYAVFQPNFRGSTGYGLKFLDADRHDLGGGDMRDILTGIAHLVAQGTIDEKRQFVYGTSYGGYMTTWLVGHTRQFRAAVAQNAVTDMNAMWHLSDLQSWTEWDVGGLPWESVDKMRSHSPLAYTHRVATPTLILHSLNDRRCPVAMGKMFYRALRERNIETEMVIYPNEGHGIKQLPHREDVLRRTLAWFAKHDVP